MRMTRMTTFGFVAAAAATAATIAVAGAQQQRAETTAAPTFAKDVAPIIYGNCVTCHRPRQAAPFSLLTYADVVKHADNIHDATYNRYMPPWHAAKAEGFPEFQDERGLSDKDLNTLLTWIDAGTPSGDLSKAPKPPVFPSGWTLGTPDLVLTLPARVSVPRDGPDIYRNVMLPVDLPDDRWITAIDYEPTARSVVHHALYFTSPSSATVRDDEVVPGLGAAAAGLRGGLGSGLGSGRAGRGAGVIGAAGEAWGGLGGWVPGSTPRFFPDHIAQPLPAHTNFVLQLHLHPSGKAEQERGRIAIYFAKTPPLKSMTGVQVPPAFGFGAGIDIPAGESRYVVKDSFVLPVGVDAYGARGHAHYLCREMKMTATLPDGSTRGLLWIKDWDFSWQDSYYFKTPFALPKGTRIDTELIYDNSDGNIRNPSSPPKRVRWGRESFDEMGSTTLLVTTADQAATATLRAAQAQHLREQVIARLRRGR